MPASNEYYEKHATIKVLANNRDLGQFVRPVRFRRQFLISLFS
jgi:hypothetical protein